MSLGKGLSALITPTATRNSRKKGQLQKNSTNGQQIWQLPINSISPNPNQPRKHFKIEELEQLANSIKEHGVLQPILVSEKVDGHYEIISGERRWRASQLVEMTEIPAIVKHIEKQQELEISLIENIQREDLNPIEEAFAYKRLMDEFNLTQQEVAEKVSKARSTVANMVRLLELPDAVKNALVEKKISTGQAKSLLSLNTEKEQLEMLSSILGEKMTVRDLERTATKINMGKKNSKVRKDPNLIYLEDQLRSSLGTKVSITKQGQTGRVTIEYYSDDEFNNIVDKLTK